ncbi:DUF935 domain-containing protein [Anabaena sp. PCC 7108]|uniref:DUF935 domain-containing protein n=1 Tax=Anabaena sp. PCC 7108 TaxID=163908 RepID=UPI00034B59BD|nr:DUF935 family protein [Anabaena sp. PCC 7108]
MSLPSEIKQEIASVERDINYIVYGGTLENPDETLLKRGGGKGLKLYDEIEEDSHAYAVLQKRKLAVIARPWEVKAASEKRLDKKAADLVRMQIETKLDHLTTELLDATLKGFSVSELMWEDSGSEIFVKEFKARDQRRFTFTPKNELRLLTRQNMVSGEAVPERKFIRHSFGAKDGNPFGRGLGSKLYFPVWFKRQGISFWLIFCEKFGMPTAVGKYGANASQAEQKKLLDALRALAQDAGVIIPEGMAIELLEATRSSTSDLYERLIRYMDEQISEAVLGETLTTNIGSVGSKAAADTHDGVRLEVSKADADLLSQTFNNTLCKWIVELNLPGANPPTIWRVFEEQEDLNTRSTRDKTLFDMGFKLKPDAVKEIYGDHYEVIDQSGGDGQTSNEDFLKNSGVDAVQATDNVPQDTNAPGFAELEDEHFLRSSGFVFLSEEIPGFAELLAVFSESSNVAVKDANSLLELKAIIETVYQDGISAIPEAYLDGDNFVGVFEDRVGEQLVKRFNFTLSESGIEYKLINPGDVSNFSEVEFAAPFKPKKKKNCVKGISCGSSCISPTKSCRKGGDAIPGDRVTALKKKLGGAASVSGDTSPSTKNQKVKSKEPATTEVKIASDVAKYFPDSESVNEALRFLGNAKNKAQDNTTKNTQAEPEKQNIQKVEVEISGNEKQAVSYDASNINVSGRVTVSERDDYGRVEVKGISSLEGKSEYPETVVKQIEHHTSPMQGSKSELGGAYELRNGKPIKSQKDFEQEINKSINTLNTEQGLNDLVPIYLVRRSLGDRISRKDFDKYMIEMQGKDKFTLFAGELKENGFSQREDSMQVMGNRRNYVQIPEPVKETLKPVEQPKAEAKKPASEPVKEIPKPKNISGFEFNDSVVKKDEFGQLASEDGHYAKLSDTKTGASIEAYIGDKNLLNRPDADSNLILGDVPQAFVLGKENDFLGKKHTATYDIGRSLPNSNDLVSIRTGRIDKKNAELLPQFLSGIASRYKEGSTIVLTPGPDDRNTGKYLSGMGLTGHPPGKKPTVFVGVVKNGKVVPVNPDKLQKQIDAGKDIRMLRDAQFEVGVYQQNAKNEELIIESLRSKEDAWVGRNPQPGKVKDSNYYEKESEEWAKSLGLGDSANGFTAEATKAHDVAHPVVHEMLGMNSKQINKLLGGFKNDDGSNSLVAEEAIVNIAEHLSRGDSFEASLINGRRIARVLSRGASDNMMKYFRSADFDNELEDLAIKIWKNDNFHDYMKVVRVHNQKSRTVTEKGNRFINTAS